MFNLPKNPGFTVIEIILAIGILSILVTLSYSGYATFTTRQKLISAGQNLKNLLRDVQSRNFNNEVNCSICNCNSPTVNSLDGWYVNFLSKQFYGRCQGNNFTVTNLNISDDVFIDTNNNIIQFFNSPPRINNDTTICLTVTGFFGKYYRIDVSRSGDISDSGGLIDTCEP